MSRPRLLDLFCGAGGAAMGYHRAGFDVVGVDLAPQKDYPFEFHQADVMVQFDDGIYEAGFGPFNAIHASPPCQAYTQMSARWRGKGGLADSHPDLIAPTRELLRSTGQPYVIENVVGAKGKMETTIKLHGGMFGLGVHRPRLFECSFLVLHNPAPQCENPIGVYGKPDGREVWRTRNSMKADGTYGKKSVINAWKSVEQGQQVMGIDWMTQEKELREAIPPAYTEFIGAQHRALCMDHRLNCCNLPVGKLYAN